MPPSKPSLYKYGIVIDSGSSGSRIQIYRWEDPVKTKQKHKKEPEVLTSPPKIEKEKNWSLKISPGISNYNTPKYLKQIWPEHYSKLMKFAEGIIPSESHRDTPVFVLATAGMRLLDPKVQKRILKETCSSIKKHTSFLLPPECRDAVQVIDGETEGIYGWLGLNYLMGQFDKYDTKQEEHESIGFMDMGGASTQIAFVPSSAEERKKHQDDLSTVTLRNIDGSTQQWNVFVETWLGFGANEARKRYLNHLISLALENPSNSGEISDPCLPKGADFRYSFNGKTYNINGVGNYEMCSKTIYPLLQKNIPCKEDPCLFNGIHGPKLNFDKDKFVGISEYWYTANDVFQSGGEYNYHGFNEKVREYCESDWQTILENSVKGKYSNLNPDTFLKDACFKANWVMNILHEGFELPRLGIDIPDKPKREVQNLDDVHVPFKSAESINGEELSWTLGKILLVASSQIQESGKKALDVGIYPSEISGKKFVPGGSSLDSGNDSDSEDENEVMHSFYSIVVFLLFFFFVYHFGKSHFGKWVYKFRKFQIPIPVKRVISTATSKVPGLSRYFGNQHLYDNLQSINEVNLNLEEGLMSTISSDANGLNSSVLRTRSTINLVEEEHSGTESEQSSQLPQPSSPQLKGSKSFSSFINKPFVVPMRNSPALYNTGNNSRDSLHRIPSSSSISRGKSSNN
ncbi:nucleoside diphosphatase [Scheffersomyces xylosifermentans]|uniref:nucleoside diphosphatase n=1 Tax=Scheffersomyces xylosifermentans TaxID=1304137 RepID=UPI00315CF287